MRGMNNMQANICLLAVTLCWSCEVVIFSIIPDDVNPFATTCVTSLIGGALLLVCFSRRIADSFRRDGWLLARRIAILGVLNTIYSVLFLIGLNNFDISTGAFTVSITAVVLPVMLLVMRRGVDLKTWISAGFVLAGILAALGPSFQPSDVEGIGVMGVGCLVRALYIVKLNDWAHQHDPVTLAAGISGANAVIAFFPWLAMQPATFMALPWSGDLVAAYFIYGYFVIAFTISLNTLAQRRATPAQATIVYSTEIVFSTIWATCLPASIVDPVELSLPIVAGCVLIVLGNLIEVAPIGKRGEDGADASVEEAGAGGEAVAAGGVLNAAGPGGSDGGSMSDAVGPGGSGAAVSGAVGPGGSGAARIGIVPDHANDLTSELLAHIRNPRTRTVVLFCILLAVYLIIALPFKVIAIIPGFADIRPVTMLMPAYGIFFGIPGCLAFAVGNLIGDIASDSLRWSSIAGLVANFVYPYLMYLFWTKLRKKPFELRSIRTVGLFAFTLVVCACVQALIITPFVHLCYPEVDALLFAELVVGNSALFPIGFAIPFLIMLQEEFGFAPLSPKGQREIQS